MTTTEAFDSSLRAEFEEWKRVQIDQDAWSAVLWATERAAKQEREECAKLCENEAVLMRSHNPNNKQAIVAQEWCAAAIRARDEGVRG